MEGPGYHVSTMQRGGLPPFVCTRPLKGSTYF